MRTRHSSSSRPNSLHVALQVCAIWIGVYVGLVLANTIFR
jgi:hypothetical protein